MLQTFFCSLLNQIVFLSLYSHIPLGNSSLCYFSPHDYKYFLELNLFKVTIQKHNFDYVTTRLKKLQYLSDTYLTSYYYAISHPNNLSVIILLSQNTQSNPNSMFTIAQEYLILCFWWYCFFCQENLFLNSSPASSLLVQFYSGFKAWIK